MNLAAQNEHHNEEKTWGLDPRNYICRVHIVKLLNKHLAKKLIFSDLSWVFPSISEVIPTGNSPGSMFHQTHGKTNLPGVVRPLLESEPKTPLESMMRTI